MRSKYLLPAALLILGAVGGWLVASGQLNVQARVAESISPEREVVRTSENTPCCEPPASLAAHNRTVQVNAERTGTKPNILVIMSDDVGPFNISAYNHGMMRYKTPNIDRLAKEGAMFTDWYGQQSCTAGRAAFIMGQTPIRSGLLKVGLPAAKLGINQDDPTLATLLKAHGYVTGQFGKNR